MSCLNEQIKYHYKTLLKFATAIAKDKAKAVDLISETFLDITQKDKLVPCSDPDFLKWFYKYMRLMTLPRSGDYHKLTHPKEIPSEISFDLPDKGQEENREPLSEYRDFKRSLDPLDKVLFELIYIQKLTLKEICRRYGNGLKIQRLHLLTRPLKAKVKMFKKNL